MIKSSLKCSILGAAIFVTASMFSAPISAQPQGPELSFYPSQPWQIAEEKSAAGLRDCFIESEFNNGFVLQFNGTDKWVQSMNIDFRQDVFDSGEKYEVSFNIPGHVNKTVKGRAISDSTLRISLSGDKDFYKSAQKSAVLDLNVEGNEFRFYLVGFGQATKGFERCMAGSTTQTPKSDMRNAKSSPAPTAKTKTASTATPSTPTPMPGEKSKTAVKAKKASVAANNNLKSLDKVEPSASRAMSDTKLALSVSKLERKISLLEVENNNLTDELNDAMKKSEDERFSLSSENWDLERATMRFNESERQLARLGKQLSRQRAQCQVEKSELESMLFDPEVTSQQQMAKLSDLESQLDKVEQEKEELRIRYEARIRILEQQMSTN